LVPTTHPIEQFSNALFDLYPVPMWMYDAVTLRFIAVNDAAIEAYGYSREEFLTMTGFDIRPADEHDRLRTWLALPKESRSVRRTGAHWRHKRRDGSIVEIEAASTTHATFEGRDAIMVVAFDVTERNRRADSLRVYRAALEEAQRMAKLGTFTLDLRDGTYKLAGMLARAYGRTEIATADRRSEVARVFHPDDAHEVRRLLESLERLEPYDGEFRMIVDGEVLWFHERTSIIRNRSLEATGVIGVAVDITDRKHEGERLRGLAFTDTATGLSNFAALFEDADLTRGRIAALLIVRLVFVAAASERAEDNRVRNAQAVAALLRKLAPADAHLVRYGDDSFAIVVPRTARLRVPLPLAKRIIAAFERPIAVGDDEYVVLPTVGIAVADDLESGISDLARNAEAALQQAERTEGRVAVYTTELSRVHDRRVTIERNLRHAVADEQVGVVYQPIVSLHTGRVVAAEALMRWDCPGIGSVPPAEFIAIAEESGVILRLGAWILREACEQRRRWDVAGLGNIRIAVNVSARQVQQREFLRLVSTTCEATDLTPSSLELELTERSMMNDDGLALRNLEALRRLGVRISVDDFGTGYSALSYLTSLPLDTVKLDRSFIAPITEDDFQAELAESVIKLSHRRGLTVVAEGVETAAQAECLRRIGCDEVQGYYFGRPMPADDFAAMLSRELLAGISPVAM
jgi:PAS domain S-box-containing protein